ncbi:MAG: GNAT family N-acetyltransferase [Pseudomonadota bacterium]
MATRQTDEPMTLHPLQGDGRIQAVAPEWRALAQDASDPNPFMEFDFVEAQLPAAAAKTPIYLLTAGEPKPWTGAIAVKLAQRFCDIPARHVTTAQLSENGLSTPLVRNGEERTFARTLLNWLDDTPNNILFLHLRQQLADATALRALAEACLEDGRMFEITASSHRPMLNLANPPAKANTPYQTRIEENWRSLMAQHAVAYTDHNTNTDIRERIEDFLELEHAGWSGALAQSHLSCPDRLMSFRKLMNSLHRQNRLYWRQLKANGAPIAMAIDITAGGRAYAFATAENPEFSQFAPQWLLAAKSPIQANSQLPVHTFIGGVGHSYTHLAETWPDRQHVVDLFIGKKGALGGAAARAFLAVNAAHGRIQPLAGQYF